MSDKIDLRLTCVHCLDNGNKEIYPVIESTNKEAIRKIENDELFLYRCPHCGYYQYIGYNCTYIDDRLKYIIVLGDNINNLKEKDISDYSLYYVDNLKSLKEKIVIMENGLDNRIIETMKNELKLSLKNKASYNLLLTNNNGLEFVLLYPDGEVIKTFGFSESKYNIIKDKYINTKISVNSSYINCD